MFIRKDSKKILIFFCKLQDTKSKGKKVDAKF